MNEQFHPNLSALIELEPPTVCCSPQAEIAAATSASRVGKSRIG